MKFITTALNAGGTMRELVQSLSRAFSHLQERLDVDSVRVGDTTKLDYNGNVTCADVDAESVDAEAFTMATGAAADKVLTSDADGTASWETTSVTGAAGSDTEVQYNNGGAFGASSNLVYNAGGKELKTRVFMAVDATGVKLSEGTNGYGIRVSDTYGNVGIKCDPGTSTQLDINGDTIRLQILKTPATSGAAGKVGMIMVDGNYIYVCVVADTWKRAALSTW